MIESKDGRSGSKGGVDINKPAPTKVVGKTDERDIDREIISLSKKINSSEDKPAVTEQDKSITAAIKNTFDMLSARDIATRKTGLAHLKAIRSEISKVDEAQSHAFDKYAKTIDAAMDNVESSTGEVSRLTEEVKKKLLDNLPAVKELKNSFINGFSPLAPFITNVTKDISGWRKNKKEAKAELSVASAISAISGDKKSDGDSESVVDAVNEVADKEAKDQSKRDKLLKKTAAKQTTLLKHIPDSIDEMSSDTVDTLSIVADNTELTAIMVSDLVDAFRDDIAMRQQDSLQALKDDSAKAKAPTLSAAPAQSAKEPGGIMSLLGDLLTGGALMGGIEGILTALGLKKVISFFKGVKKVGATLEAVGEGGKFASILKLGKVFGRILAKFGIVTTVIFAVIDFIDGFSDAANILGKTDVDIRDRIAAGIGSMIGGIVGIVDDIAEFFGIDTTIGGKKLGEWAKVLFAKMWSDLLHPLETVDAAVAWLKDKWANISIKSMYEGVFDKAMELFNSLTTMISDYLKGVAKNVTSFLPDALIPEAIKSWMNSPSGNANVQSVKKAESVDRLDVVKQYADDKTLPGSQPTEQAGGNTVVAPSNTSVNNTNVNTYTPAPIQTLNTDMSIRARLGVA